MLERFLIQNSCASCRIPFLQIQWREILIGRAKLPLRRDIRAAQQRRPYQTDEVVLWGRLSHQGNLRGKIISVARCAREEVAKLWLQGGFVAQEKYIDCIEACNHCANECSFCASESLREKDVKTMARCIELDRDCSALCRTASLLMSADSRFAPGICGLCAEECRKQDAEHCQRCADVCDECAEECEKMSAQHA